MAKTSDKSADNFGKKLLTEMANLHDEGAARFWKNWRFKNESSATLYGLRDELRQIWERKLSNSRITEILDQWANYSRFGLQGIGYRQWKVTLHPPRILPQATNLRGYLVFAVLVYLPLLRVCGNPGCPVAYFVGRRHDQRYCERGVCTAYAQRRYSKRYWDTKGRDRRKSKSKGTEKGK